ncbi:MAG: Hsp20/alpha crystallin family protein [Thaumarchaeota archaeon]|nr:Hsp20/alpha crystallin family protein [Nitrososphaerota archaeon]
MRKTRTYSYQEMVSTAVTIGGIALIALLGFILVRVQRGLLGIILAVIAVVLIAYWLTEMRRTVKKELNPIIPKKSWQYEIMDGGSEMTFVAEVPGPSEKIKVNFVKDVLEIEGGSGFKQSVNIPVKVEVGNYSYLNGVLQVKMRKTQS